MGAAAYVAAIGLTVLAPSPPAHTTNEVRDKSYVVSQPFTVTVGESAIRVKSYQSVTTEADAYVSETAFVARAGLGRTAVQPGQKLPIRGRLVVEGRTYDLVSIREDSGVVFALGIAEDGSLYPRLISTAATLGFWQHVLGKLNIDGEARFSRSKIASQTSQPTGENFEILYLGRDATSIRFEYREYTKDDLARPAFSQSVTYPSAPGTYRFRKIEFVVREIGPDAITLSVERD